MSSILENNGMRGDDVDPQFCEDYQKKVTHLRFLGGLNSALSGATFVAVMTLVGNALISLPKVAAVASATTGAATTTAATYATVTGLGFIDAALPALGFVNWPLALGLVVLGLTCSYLATKYYQHAGILDSDFNARKIAAATGHGRNSPETKVAVEIEKEGHETKPKALPPIINSNEMGAAHGLSQQDMVTGDAAIPATTVTAERALADTIVSRGAANENTKQPDAVANASWQDKALAAMHEPQTLQAKG